MRDAETLGIDRPATPDATTVDFCTEGVASPAIVGCHHVHVMQQNDCFRSFLARRQSGDEIRPTLRRDQELGGDSLPVQDLCLGEMTTGAGNDIEVATETARKMVCEWGMSEKMGPLTYGSKEEQVFLGKDFSTRKDFSDETAKLIDLEVKALVMGGYNQATELLTDNRDKLEKLALALLEHETLDLKEITELIDGKKPDDEDPGDKIEEVSDEAAQVDLKNKKKDGGVGDSDGLLGGMPDPSPA